TFQVTLGAGSGARTVPRLELRQNGGGGGVWDTDPATANWALGAAASLDGALLNAGTGTVSFAVADGGVFFVFASDFSPTQFSSGASFTLTASFADGSSAVTTVTLTVPTIASVSPSSGAPGASLTVSVTGTNFQAGAGGSCAARAPRGLSRCVRPHLAPAPRTQTPPRPTWPWRARPASPARSLAPRAGLPASPWPTAESSSCSPPM